MKKVLLSLLLAIACVPMAFSQTKAGHVVTFDTTICGSYMWIDSVTYSTDTVALYSKGDTTYVLNLTKHAPSINVTLIDTAYGQCSVNWKDDTVWTTAGLHAYTMVNGAYNGCDSIDSVVVILTGFDTVDIDTVKCGYFLAPWGDSITSSMTFVDSTIITENCEFLASLNLTINPVYVDDTVETTAGCSLTWNGTTIVDTAVHSMKLTTALGCDSTVSIHVTAFTNHDYDTNHIIACDYYLTEDEDTVRANTIIYRTDTIGLCLKHITNDIVVAPSYHDTTNTVIRDTIGHCYIQWNGQTFDSTDVDSVIYGYTEAVTSGCDSLVAIRITSFTGTQYDTTNVEYCGVYVWGTDSLRTTGQYTHTSIDTTTKPKCTSISILNLTLHDEFDTISATACETYTYTYLSHLGRAGLRDTLTLNASGTYDTSDYPNFYTKHFATKCITYHTLNLNIIDVDQRDRGYTVIDTACERFVYSFNGKSGLAFLFSDVDENHHIDTTLIAGRRTTRSCYDSIAHFDLIIHDKSYSDVYVDTCDSYFWAADGQTYTRNTTAEKRLDTTNFYGCDTLSRLHLTINYTPDVHIEGNWNLQPGETAHLTAVCDEPVVNNWYKDNVLYKSNVNSIEVTAPSNDFNTDIRLESTNNKGCVAKNWITITYNVGIDEAENMEVNLYPNPTTRYLNVESADGLREVVIYNTVGQQVIVRNVNSTYTQLDLGNLAAGTYLMRIVSQNGEEATRKFTVNK